MKIYKSITFKLFIVLSLILTAFMCILVYVQVFVIGRSYSISEYTLERERQLSPLISQFIYNNYLPGTGKSPYNPEGSFDLDGMRVFENANDVNLVIYNNKLEAFYTRQTKNTIKPYYINYIRNNLQSVNLYDKYVPADSFRIYDSLGFPTQYIAFVTPFHPGDNIQYVVTVIPEVFTTRTSGILKGYIVYIFLFLLILIFAVSALFSYFVTKPVVKIGRTTSKIAVLDFSEKCEEKNEDEIGNLGKTINSMSSKLQVTIENLSDANKRLQKDLNLRNELDLLRKEFVGAITHEFKTPITLIRGYTESIKDNVAEGMEKDSALNTIIEETEKMDKLVKDLLDLSKLESMGYKLNISEFYINELLDNIGKKYERIIAERDIKFTISNPCGSVLVKGDPFRIEQVLSNFINNAIENTPARKEITLALENKGDHIAVSVHNQGKNIDEDEINRVWEKFYRVEKSRNKKLGGTGLGLAISKSILDLHKSSYGIENTSDGVKFFFTLEYVR